MAVLALDLGVATCAVGLVAEGRVLGEQQATITAGQHAVALPALVAAALAQSRVAPVELRLVAALPAAGISFTGLRAGMALVAGFALSRGIPVARLSLLAVLAAPDVVAGRACWCATRADSGAVWLERAEGITLCPLAALPDPAGPLAVLGNAADDVAAALRQAGHDVLALSGRSADLVAIAAAGLRHLAADPAPELPLYAASRPLVLHRQPARPAPD